MNYAVKKENKYKNENVNILNNKFSSRLESKAFLVLQDMSKKGLIKDLRLQTVYILEEGFQTVYYDGKRSKVRKTKTRDVTYVADFDFKTLDGQKVVVETKGLEDQKYPIKKKLLLKKYPDIWFLELRNEGQIAKIDEILEEFKKNKNN